MTNFLSRSKPIKRRVLGSVEKDLSLLGDTVLLFREGQRNSLFRSPSNKLVTWQTDNADRVLVKVDGSLKSQASSGSINVTGFGTKNVTFDVETNRRCGLVVTVDGQQVISTNNHTQRVTGYEPCEERIDLDSASGSCPPDYLKESETSKEYQVIYYARDASGPYDQSSGRFYDSKNWQSYDTSFERINGQYVRSGVWVNVGINSDHVYPQPQRRWEKSERSTTSYFCSVQDSCQGEPIYELTNSGDFKRSTSFSVQYTQAELNAQTQAQLEEEQRRLAELEAANQGPTETDQDIIDTQDDIQDTLDKILSNNEQNALNQQNYYGLIEQPENPTDSKYRVISPPTFSIVNGKRVPDIRYESVRFLSPENVSSFVLRGYEVNSVASNIPTSASKPYGQSIVARTNQIKSKENNVEQCSNCAENRRTTWADFNKRRATVQNFPQTGGVRKRTNTRKVVR